MKRNAPIQVALTADDLAMVDAHREGIVFNVSRSEFGLVAIRATLDSLRRGGWSVESLFQQYLKRPLGPLSGIDRREVELSAHQEAALLRCMSARRCTRQQAFDYIFSLGAEIGEACGFGDEAMAEEAEERKAG